MWGLFLWGDMEIEFVASLPDILTAITISGEGATRVKFDIPESEIANAVKLVLLKGKAFRVRISIEEQMEQLEGLRLDG